MIRHIVVFMLRKTDGDESHVKVKNEVKYISTVKEQSAAVNFHC